MNHMLHGANRAPMLVGGAILGVFVGGLCLLAVGQSFGLPFQALAAAAGMFVAHKLG